MIECSGQGKSSQVEWLNARSRHGETDKTKIGGWDRITEEIPQDWGRQIDQTFANIEHALQQSGGKGWEQVYKVRCYTAPLDMDAAEHLVRNLRKYCPNHQPLLTVVGVEELAFENMRIEMEAAAHLGS